MFKVVVRDGRTVVVVFLVCFAYYSADYCARGWGGGVLPIMAYTGRLRPKGVPFSAFRYMKG